MGNKDKGKRETKKPAKKHPKPAPGRKRDEFSRAGARIVPEAADKP
jgi:hypothetical protein